MTRRLRIGVLGLGRRWPRYRHALAALRDEVRLTAVCDPSAERGDEEATALGCRCAGGVIELIESADVDAVVLPGPAWYGLWPLEHAARCGKPVLCGVSPVQDETHVDTLRTRLGATANVHFALWPALSMAADVLAERLNESLGEVRFLQASRTRAGDAARHGSGLKSPTVLALLRSCADLFDAAPEAITCTGAEGQAGFASVVLEFAGGAVAQLTLWTGAAAASTARLHVEAEGGSARLDLPRRVEWFDGAGRHRLELPAGLAEGVLLDRFVQAIRDDQPPECDLPRACAALDWLRAARDSLATGRRVLVTDGCR